MPHEFVDLRSSMLITPKGYTVSNEGFFSSIIDAIVKFFSKLLGSGESGGSGGSSGGSTNTGSLVIKKISSDTDELIDRFFKLKKEAVTVASKKQESNDENGTRGLKEIWDDQISNADKDKVSEKCKKTETTNPDILRCFYSRRQGGNDRILNGDNFAKTYLVDEVLEVIRACSNAKVFNLDICHLIRYVDEQYTSIIKKMAEDMGIDNEAVTIEQRKRYASMIITGLLNRGSSQNLTGYIYDASYMENDELNEGIPTSVCFGHALLFDKALEIMTACKAINKKGISLIKDTITDANIEKAFDKFAGQVTSDVNDIISTSEFKEIDDSLRNDLPDRICKELTLVFTDVYRLLVKYVISAHKLTNYFAKSVMVFCPATEISKESYTPLRRLPIRQSVSLYPTVFTTPEGYTVSNENFIKDIIDAIIKFFSKLFGGGDSSGGSGSSTTATNVIKKTLTTTQEMIDEFYKFLETDKPSKQWTAHLGARGMHGTSTSELKVRSCFYERDGARESDLNILPDGNNLNLDAYVDDTNIFIRHIKMSKVFESDMVKLISSIEKEFDEAVLELVKLESSDEPNKESKRKEIIIEYTEEFIYKICNRTVSGHGLIAYCLDSNIEDRKDNIEAGLPESITMGMYIDLDQAREIMSTVKLICNAGLELTRKSASESKIETNLQKAGEVIGKTILANIDALKLNLTDSQKSSLVAHVHKTVLGILMSVSKILVTFVLNTAALCHYLAKAVMSFCPGVTFSKESYIDIHKPMKYLTTPDTTYKESVSLLPDYRIFTTN